MEIKFISTTVNFIVDKHHCKVLFAGQHEKLKYHLNVDGGNVLSGEMQCGHGNKTNALRIVKSYFNK